MKRICTLLLLCLMPACTPAPPLTIRVMSYNIHHGEGTDGRLDLPRIAEVIRREAPDIVALQEVDRGVTRTGGVDQPAVLGDLTGMKSVFVSNTRIQGGEYGNAVLTRIPIVYHQNHPLPNLAAGEPRGLLEIGLAVQRRPLLFFATHLDHRPNDAERQASARAIRTLLAQHPDDAVILAGDFNATPESAPIVELRSFLQDSFLAGTTQPFTFPASQPKRRIDYIMFREKAGLQRVEYRIIDEAVASDHRPIVAVLSLSKASAGGS